MIAEAVKRVGWAQAFHADIYIEKNDESIRCDRCGSVPEYIVHDIVSGRYLCIPCTVTVLEDVVDTFRKTGSLLTESDNGEH